MDAGLGVGPKVLALVAQMNRWERSVAALSTNAESAVMMFTEETCLVITCAACLESCA